MNAAHDRENNTPEQSRQQPLRAPRLDLPWRPLPFEFEDALCASSGLPPALWDVYVDGESRAQQSLRRALASQVCAVCPIRKLCEQTAEADPTAAGVWGGRVFNPKIKGLDEVKILIQAVAKPCGDSARKIA
jgi:hypothetical protein